MRSNIKIFFMLFVLLLLDTVKPFGYTLSVDFLLLGVIFISLNKKLNISLIFSLIFGYIRSTLIIDTNLSTIIRYSIISLICHYLLTYLNTVGKKRYTTLVKNFIAMTAIIIHIGMNLIQAKVFLPSLALISLLQSSFVYIFVSSLLEKCNYFFLSSKAAR